MCGARPGIATGPHGAEAVLAARVGRRPAPARENRVVEAAGGVRLPDLEDHVIERLAVELGDAARDFDRLGGTGREVVHALREFRRKERAERHLGGRDEALHGMRAAALRPRTTSSCS